jgi:hypothetical protein
MTHSQRQPQPEHAPASVEGRLPGGSRRPADAVGSPKKLGITPKDCSADRCSQSETGAKALVSESGRSTRVVHKSVVGLATLSDLPVSNKSDMVGPADADHS